MLLEPRRIILVSSKNLTQDERTALEMQIAESEKRISDYNVKIENEKKAYALTLAHLKDLQD